MKVFLTLKCSFNDSVYFIQQFTEQEIIDKVLVFRDKAIIPLPKTVYITDWASSLGKINILFRFLQMICRKKENPDVIIGIYEIPHGLLAVLVGILFGKPSIVSIIGNPAYSKLRKGLRMKLTMWILKKAKFITVTGNASKSFLERIGLPEEKVYVLPNTINFTGFYPIHGIKKEYDIVSLGRLSNEKKISQLVKVVAELKKSDPTIKAAIGGVGPEKQHIKKKIHDLNLETNIELNGFIPDEELAAYFSKGKVFVLTSETEGFPRTIIQAASCGIPVVASRVGDIADIIEHGINGFLVDNWKDTQCFVNNINTLLTEPQLVQDFSYRLNGKVRKQFATKQAVKVWGNILNELKTNGL